MDYQTNTTGYYPDPIPGGAATPGPGNPAGYEPYPRRTAHDAINEIISGLRDQIFQLEQLQSALPYKLGQAADSFLVDLLYAYEYR